MEHCYSGITHKSAENHGELEEAACSNQEEVQYNKTSGQLADDTAEYSIRSYFCSLNIVYCN